MVFRFDRLELSALRYGMLPHERFQAWQFGHELAVEVYRATARWPSDERFGLTSQARRAAVSVVANIAEGSARRGGVEFRRYLNISIGSLAELACLLRLARDIGIATRPEWERLEALRDATGKRVWGLYRSIGCQLSAAAAARHQPNARTPSRQSAPLLPQRPPANFPGSTGAR